MVVILDGINNLTSSYHDLSWLPLEPPPNVHIILSSSPIPKIMEIVKMRSGEEISTINQINKSVAGKWMHIPIQPLALYERQTILQTQCSLHGHALEVKVV